MILDKRINIYKPDAFRPRLSLEDVVEGVGQLVDVYSSNELLSSDKVQFSEKALVLLDNPLVIPNRPYLYSSRLSSLKDPSLDRCVRDLMFLNPTIGDIGIGKMVTWIVRYFVGFDGEGKKELSYEQLLPIVSRLCGKYNGGDVDIVESNKVILYKKDSLLLSGDKRWYSNNYRSKRITILSGQLIHEGAIIASKNTYNLLRIDKPTVLKHTEKIKTIKTINKYIEPRTLSLLEDENQKRYFKTQSSVEKYLEFVDMYDGKSTLDYYTSTLGISKSTAVEFKKLLIKQNNLK